MSFSDAVFGGFDVLLFDSFNVFVHARAEFLLESCLAYVGLDFVDARLLSS